MLALPFPITHLNFIMHFHAHTKLLSPIIIIIIIFNFLNYRNYNFF